MSRYAANMSAIGFATLDYPIGNLKSNWDSDLEEYFKVKNKHF